MRIIELLEKYPWPTRSDNREEIIEHIISVPVSGDINLLWSWLSDTSRINRYLGMANRDEFEKDGNLIITTESLGFPQSWIEYPWKWVRGESIVVDRDYIHGFAKKNHSIFYFEENTIHIYMGFIPTNFFSKVIFKLGLKKIMGQIAELIQLMDIDAQKGLQLPHFFEQNNTKFSIYQKQILNQRLQNAINNGLERALLKKIEALISEGDELDLYRLRVKELAKKWDIDSKKLIKNFIILSHCKVFDLSWDIICPSCHGPRTETANLVNLLKMDECDACKIQFETNFERAIEVTFKVNPDIRAIKELQFCAAEPAKKKQIYAQWKIKSGQTITQNLSLEDGEYIVRSISKTEGLSISVSKNESKVIDWKTNEPQEIKSNNDFNLNFTNHDNEDKIFVLEKRFKNPYFLEPAEIFSLREFRNFFKDEKIGNGVQLYLGDQVVLFTDIVSSTRLYERVGDTEAYLQVKSHFDDVYRIFEEQEGVIIKTIGDAVMASFPTPNHAIQASKNLHQYFDRKHTNFDFDLRISAHVGKAIGVNQNTGVDYFGNTVNVSAKLQALADEQQLAISEKFYKLLSDDYLRDWDIEELNFNIPGKAEPLRAVRLTLK
ncbi:adenylate/guanylate cyclase domain-containing protein [Bacteriovorax sp. Seq25_V]|uniref:adenylate/guanylate cyclase domain-containing protein n=1 Tax=Bacteriovorax sp. Seq25_V TaxID=1201288 RepID=UPI00038A3720|nr:adenylate/guanylate cyclase domain-containing protein [Bacteriovorax sp. Seq25_V]EQC47540.1 adenylate/guanylate cyclase catalytic domain protein [Bacteriovorax sp. Seq25_V]